MAFFGHDQHLRRKLYNRYYTSSTEYVQNSVKCEIHLAFVIYVNTTAGLYYMYLYYTTTGFYLGT